MPVSSGRRRVVAPRPRVWRRAVPRQPAASRGEARRLRAAASECVFLRRPAAAVTPPAAAPWLASAALRCAVPRRPALVPAFPAGPLHCPALALGSAVPRRPALEFPAGALRRHFAAPAPPAPRRRTGFPSKAAQTRPRQWMGWRSSPRMARPKACRVATSSLDRSAANLVCRPWQGNQTSRRWRRPTPRGCPETTPARRPDLPRQPGRRRPQNASSNTRPISFERSFGPPSAAKTTPLWRDYVRATGPVQRNLRPCLTVSRGEKALCLQKSLIPSGAKASRGARAQTQPRRRALLHHLAAEAEQRRRPPPGRGRGLAGRLDQGRRLDQPAEVLLVQVAPRDRLHGALQLREGELARHQLEYDRTVFELGAQPRDGGGEDAAVIEAHRLSQPGHGLPRQRGLAAVAARLLDQTGLIEELVAVERLLFVPRAAAEREARTHALAAAERARGRGLGGTARPILEQRQDNLVEDLRPLIAPIFPREEAIPWFEPGAGRAQGGEILRHAREREITDRDHVGAGIARPRVAAAIAEGVKLLHIADRKAGLRLDPRPQPDFEGAVRERIERPERQPRARLARGAVAGHENGGLLVLHRDDRGGEPDLDRRERGVGHGGSVASALDVARVNMPSNGPRRACL